MPSYAVVGASRGVGLEYVRQLVSPSQRSTPPVCELLVTGQQARFLGLCDRKECTGRDLPEAGRRGIEECTCLRG